MILGSSLHVFDGHQRARDHAVRIENAIEVVDLVLDDACGPANDERIAMQGALTIIERHLDRMVLCVADDQLAENTP